MFYAIRHFTRFRYSHLVWQTMMEVRMHPRSEGNQRCFVFQLAVNPRARIFRYTDSYGNLVHHFDLPSRHGQLTIISDALVNIDAQPAVPELMPYEGWSDLEQLVENKDYWDMLMPSHFARPSPELEELAKEIGATERDGRSPLAFLKDLATGTLRMVAARPGRPAPNGSSQGVVISPDGAHVAFAAAAQNLVPADNNHAVDLFVLDRSGPRYPPATTRPTAAKLVPTTRPARS